MIFEQHKKAPNIYTAECWYENYADIHLGHSAQTPELALKGLLDQLRKMRDDFDKFIKSKE